MNCRQMRTHSAIFMFASLLKRVDIIKSLEVTMFRLRVNPILAGLCHPQQQSHRSCLPLVDSEKIMEENKYTSNSASLF